MNYTINVAAVRNQIRCRFRSGFVMMMKPNYLSSCVGDTLSHGLPTQLAQISRDDMYKLGREYVHAIADALVAARNDPDSPAGQRIVRTSDPALKLVSGPSHMLDLSIDPWLPIMNLVLTLTRPYRSCHDKVATCP